MGTHNTPPALPCACAALRRAARAVTQLYDRELRAAGVRPTQFTILQVLDRRERLRQGDFGELLALDATTLTRTLKLLERDGLIASEPGKDRRERYWVLTAAGKKQIEEARPAWERAQERLKDSLDDLPWSEMMQVADTITYAAKRGKDESNDK